MREAAATPASVNHHARLRSELYALLALGFKYPTRELFRGFKEGDFLGALGDVAAELPHLSAVAGDIAEAAKTVADGLLGVSFGAFEVKYVSTFDVGFPEPPCPPYEGLHREDQERTALMIEVAEFYKTFGLRMSQAEDRRELPDHLVAELEFMHFLVAKEAQAREEGRAELLRGYVLAQNDFLERHLVGWLPVLAGKLEKVRDLHLYPQLARVAARIASAEREHAAATLAELPPAPQPEGPPAAGADPDAAPPAEAVPEPARAVAARAGA